jgi:hypothetical protein
MATVIAMLTNAMTDMMPHYSFGQSQARKPIQTFLPQEQLQPSN